MKIIKKIVRKIIPSTKDAVKCILQKELENCNKILDLGCGENSPLGLLKDDKKFKDLYSVGVDIFSPYILKNIEEYKIHSEYINKNIFEIDFPEKSFDCALLLDVIEHFNKNDFLNFLPRLEKMVKKIIIITPNGFVPQEEYNENPYQIHKSGWTVDELKNLGFECYGLSGLKEIQNLNIKPRFIKTLFSDLSQFFVYKKPEKAFHLIALKNII